MKILYFMNHADKGGAFLALYDLILEIKKNHKNIEPIVINSKKNDLNKLLDNINVENYSAPFKNFISSSKKPKILFKFLLKVRYYIAKPIAIKKIEKLIDFTTIDIIHSNLDRIDIGAYFSKKYNIRHIWHIREHLDDDFEVMSIYNNYVKYMNKFNSEFVFISKSVFNKWKNRKLKLNKYYIIYDGINEQKLILHNIKNNEDLKIIFLGGYSQNKGQSFFIDSVGKMNNLLKEKIYVDFFGNGDKHYINYLKKKIKMYHLENNFFIYDYDNKIYEKLNNYDIGINCSNSEGFGRITVEYMLAGLCPIVTDTGANSEIINNKINGLIFKNNSQKELQNILTNIYSNNFNINYLKYNARNDALNRFTMKNHAQNIVELYKKGDDIYER